jgi:hypothetical protein
LNTGKKVRWDRADILGVLKPEYMPDWAAERLQQIFKQQGHEKARREPEKER